MKTTINLILAVWWLINVSACTSPRQSTLKQTSDILLSNEKGKGQPLEIIFEKGRKHNHPLLVFWVETTDSLYIQTLWIAESIGRGVFTHGNASTGKWMPGPLRRPAALPYWAFKRNVAEDDGLYVPTISTPMADAYTGATPMGNFMLQTRLDKHMDKPFIVLMEINQSWDFNEFWTNSKFTDEPEYNTSCQPSLIYAVTVDPSQPNKMYELTPIGHGHYAGKNGNLYPDLSTFTTALEITKGVIVQIK